MRLDIAAGVALAVGSGCGGFVEVEQSETSSASTSSPSSSAHGGRATEEPRDSSATNSTGVATEAGTTSLEATSATSGTTEAEVSTSTSTSTNTSTGSTATSVGTDCEDGILGGEETDVDCGGPCDACEFGEQCLVGTDCSTGLCDPSDTCGVQAPLVWLDASDDATLYGDDACTVSPPADGQPAFCWSNKGTAAGFFLAGGSRPAYIADIDGLEFNDSPLVSDAEIFGGPLGDVTLFLVQQEWASRNSFDFNLNHPATGPNRYSSHIPWGNNNRHVTFDIGGGGAGRIETPPGLIEVDETHLFSFVNSPEENLRLINIDGTEEASGVGNLSADAGTVSIGNDSRVRVFEVRIYSPSPTLGQRQLIEGQLACRWDLRHQLPDTHPYYDADGAQEAGCPPEP